MKKFGNILNDASLSIYGRFGLLLFLFLCILNTFYSDLLLEYS